jgi:flagellar export protein FliJ
LEEQFAELATEITNLESMRRSALSVPSINVDPLMDAQRYQGVLLAQQNKMREQIRLLTAEVERRREAVVEADRQVKVLEKLHEHKLEEHRKEQLRAETKILDEVAARGGQEDDLWQV